MSTKIHDQKQHRLLHAFARVESLDTLTAAEGRASGLNTGRALDRFYSTPNRVRRLWVRLMVAVRGEVAAFTLLAVAAGLASLSIPLAFDHMVSAGTLSMSAFGVFAGCYILAKVLDQLRAWRETRALMLVLQMVERASYREIVRKSPRLAGESVAYISSYAPQLTQIVYSADLVVALLFSVLASVILVTKTGIAGLVGLAATLLATWAMASLIRRIGVIYGEYIEAEGKRNSVVEKVARQASRIGLQGLSAAAEQKVEAIRTGQLSVLRRRATLQTVNRTIESSLIYLLAAAVYVAGSLLGEATKAASLLTVLVLLGTLLGHVQNALANYRVLRQTPVPLRKFSELLDSDSPQNGPAGEGSTFEDGSALTLESLTARVGLAGSVVVVGSDDDRRRTLEEMRNSFPTEASCLIPRETAWPALPPTEVVRELGLSAEKLRVLLGELDFAGGTRDRILGAQGPRSARAHELSEGERARLTLILALAARPEVLLVDDLFSHLPPAQAEQAISVLRRHHPGLLIVASERPEVIAAAEFRLEPTGHSLRLVRQSEQSVVGAPAACQPDPSPASTRSDDSEAPSDPPVPNLRTALSTGRRLFGRTAVITIMVAAAGVALAEAGYAFVTGHAPSVVWAAPRVLTTAVLVLLIAATYFGCVFAAPVTRIGQIHHSVIQKVLHGRIALSPANLAGRLTQDFGTLEMETPGAVAGLLLVGSQLAVSAAVVVTNAWQTLPLLVLVLAATVPVIKRCRAARTAGAHLRAAVRPPLLDRAGVQAATSLFRSSSSIRSWAERDFAKAADRQLAAAMRAGLADIRARINMDTLIAVLVLGGCAAALFFGGDSAPVACFLLITFSQSINTFANRLQTTSVNMANSGRALDLLKMESEESSRTAGADEGTDAALATVRSALALDGAVAIVGRSGAGKSVLLREFETHSDRPTRLIDHAPALTVLSPADLAGSSRAYDALVSTLPAPWQAAMPDAQTALDELSRSQQQLVMCAHALADSTSDLLLDEATGALPIQLERVVLLELVDRCRQDSRQLAVVLHRTENSDLLPRTISIGVEIAA